MHPDTAKYNQVLDPEDRKICDLLAAEIARHLPEAENKIWHRHPVWFLDGNPVVGYSKLKNCVRLLFWSGRSFDEEGLENEGSFKAAEARYTAAHQVKKKDLKRWLLKARDIQWDYKNIVKRKGKLERLTKPSAPANAIDAYIAGHPKSVQDILQRIRGIIRKAAPEAEETMNYGIPTFVLNGNLVHFAAFERHLGFYPTPSAIVHFKDELSEYKHAKGSVQFPLDAPIPYPLITQIVKFRVKQNRETKPSTPSRRKSAKKTSKRM